MIDLLTVYSAKILQTALNENGGRLKVDGLVGPKTKAAFKKYQDKISEYDLGDTLYSLGLGFTFSLRKRKTNVKIEKERPEETTPPEEPKDSKPKARRTIKLPTKLSECFKNKLWIDGAVKGPNVVAKGKYKTSTGRPIGAVVHFTAGWNKPGSAKKSLSRTRYGFNCIDIIQGVFQPKNLPLNVYGNHAGTSKAFLVGYGNTSSCSNKLVGYEMNCGGKLEKKNGKWQTWFGKVVPKENRRYLAKDSIYYGPKGWYEVYSKEQEQDLEDVLVWHCLNDRHFKWQNILGHHEVAGKRFLGRWRKNDPGASLSMDMEQLRQRVRKRVKAVIGK